MTLPWGVVTPWPERVVATITRLVLPPYSAGGAPGDDLQGLNRIDRNLIGKNFALLVGDGLAVHRKRILRVIAQSVKQAVRIGSDSWRRQRNQRTYRRRLVFKRNFVEQSAVDVGVAGGIVFNQISSSSLR